MSLVVTIITKKSHSYERLLLVEILLLTIAGITAITIDTSTVWISARF
jgi:hypothetical protein